MKAIKVKSFTKENRLILADCPTPAVAPGEVVIEIEIAGTGTVDLLASKGLYPGLSEPGFIPGLEVAGIVISAGYGNQQRILIRGAGGGIGSMTVILALMTGTHETAVFSSPEKEQKLISIGVTKFVNGKRTDSFSDLYDIIIDPVAGPDIDHFATMLDNNGYYLLNGIAAGFPDPTFGSALLTGFQKSLTISTLSLNSIPLSNLKSTMENLFEMAANGRLKPVIDKVYTLADAYQAHRDLEAGSAFGKILLGIRS